MTAETVVRIFNADVDKYEKMVWNVSQTKSTKRKKKLYDQALKFAAELQERRKTLPKK